nr:glycosyltransferase family 92 protein [uncultured Pseudomonas sp.]
MKIAAVAIVKNESSYLDEWILYHTGIGIDHFFIYDNFSSDDTYEVLSPYIQGGLITLIHWPLMRGQDDAYAHAFKTQTASFDWVTCFDIDEFYLLKQHDSLKDFLASYSDFEQIIVPWRFFGHGGHIQRPIGLVVENYTTCDNKLHTHTKYFVKPNKVADAGVHVCTTKNKLSVNENKQILDEGRFHANHTAEIIQLNHYYTRSYSEYEIKINRGQADGRDLKRLESFKQYDFTTTDSSLIKYSSDIKTKMFLINKAKHATPINSGFLSDLLLPQDNLPIKYVIRDYVDEASRQDKSLIEKHLKYNFGSILKAHSGRTDDLLTILHRFGDSLTASSCSHKSNINDVNFGVPFVIGSITVADREEVSFEATGTNWKGEPISRNVTFIAPSEGIWCFALAIGRMFVTSTTVRGYLSTGRPFSTTENIDFRLISIW